MVAAQDTHDGAARHLPPIAARLTIDHDQVGLVQRTRVRKSESQLPESPVVHNAATTQRAIADQYGHTTQHVIDDLVIIQNLVGVGVRGAVRRVPDHQIQGFEPIATRRRIVSRTIERTNRVEEGSPEVGRCPIERDRPAVEGIEMHVGELNDACVDVDVGYPVT